MRKPRKLAVVASRSAESALADGSEDAGFATTLAKGLAVLEAFRVNDAWLGNGELATRTGLARPTVARLSYTLAELGYLYYDAAKAKYRLGARSLRMAHPLLAGLSFRQFARPLMQELAVSVGGTVSIGLLHGTESVYIETARSGDVGAHIPDLGMAIPILRSAIGRALAAMLSVEEAAAIDARLRTESADDWTVYNERYIAGRRACAESGVSISSGDWITAVCAVGVPLFRARETGDCFALNCGVPAFRLRPGQLESDIAPRLRALAVNIRSIADEVEPVLYAPKAVRRSSNKRAGT
ncbi:IclR family transcriptional regulator [Nitrobacteraceae bacterium UC4446_H13]